MQAPSQEFVLGQAFSMVAFPILQATIHRGHYDTVDPTSEVGQVMELDMGDTRNPKVKFYRHIFRNQSDAWLNEPANKVLMEALSQLAFPPSSSLGKRQRREEPTFATLSEAYLKKRLFLQKYPLPDGFDVSSVAEQSATLGDPVSVAMVVCLWEFHVECGTPYSKQGFSQMKYPAAQMNIDQFVLCLLSILHVIGWRNGQLLPSNGRSVHSWKSKANDQGVNHFPAIMAMAEFLLAHKNCSMAKHEASQRTDISIEDVPQIKVLDKVSSVTARYNSGLFSSEWWSKQDDPKDKALAVGKLYFPNYQLINVVSDRLFYKAAGVVRKVSQDDLKLTKKQKASYRANNLRIPCRGARGMAIFPGEEEDLDSEDDSEDDSSDEED